MTMKDKEPIKITSKGGGSIIKKTPIFSPDGQYVFVIWKNVIRSYNVETGERVMDYTGCDDDIIGAGIHPQNSLLLIGCTTSGELAVWKWQAHLLLSKKKINKDVDKIHNFQLLQSKIQSETNDCEILLLSSYKNNYNLSIYSLQDGKFLRELPIFINKEIISLQLGGSSYNQFVAVLFSSQFLVMKLDGSKNVVKCKSKQKDFTCMTCHPEEECVATGDKTGRVQIWRGLFSNSSPSKALFHWHTLPVNTLAFSQSGTYLYSGGNECVLVKWRVNNLEKNFLPRLPAPIMHITVSQGNSFMAISTKNNAIHLIDTHFKIKNVIQHLTWAASVDVGLKVDYRTKSIVLNGHVGNLQFYSPHTMALLYNLDVVGQNKLTEERNLHIPNTNVSKIALTKLGNWLACIEERRDNNICQEIRLKFFQFDEMNQLFTLNTSIEYPHEKGVNSLEFQPSNNSAELLCATSGNDNQFKIWSLVDTTNIYRKSTGWRCTSSAYYKNLPSTSLSFSTDGSLLAVAFGFCLTAWSPDTCDLKCSLVHPSYKESLQKVQFGNVDECHLLVAVSTERVCVWNLLTLALVWTVPLKVAHLCADPLSTYMAAITDDNEMFIFSPGCSIPIEHKKNLNTDGSKVLSAAFVPRISEYTGCLQWQRYSQLYFINSNQELQCIETENESSETTALEFSAQPERSAFGALLAQTTTKDVQSSENILHKGKGLPGATDIKQLIAPPVHTMAPMRLLCNSVLRSFISLEGPSVSPQEVDEESDDSEELTKTSDSESDKDATKRHTIKKPKDKTDKPVSKINKEILQAVLSEPLKWTSILVD